MATFVTTAVILWQLQEGKETTRNRHTENKGTNEHDWIKITAIFLKKTTNNTWGWPIQAETCSNFEDLKSDKCWEHYEVF
jgi:hypothetical protein